ncbi:MAG: hypothetical protein IT379_39940 [Deltaproteobacteria bacterium]|nr:hypothetical protein [Deltaproteobacteria bacterium]
MRHPTAAVVLATLFAACDPSATEPQPGITKPPPAPACEVVACRHVADCAPSLTGGVDWRTEGACLASGWTCYEPEACLEAVAALPCLPDDRLPTDAELDATTRAFVEVRRSCLGPPY